MKKRNNKSVQRPRRQPRRHTQETTKFLHSLGQTAGTFLGGPVGGQLGLAAGKLISKITGFGDYKVSKNSISMGNSVPTFQTKTGGMAACHREFLADIRGSTGFVNRTFPINPGLLTTFPYLSAIAANFEEYSLEGLVFEYRPSSGSAVSSTSSALGVVVMATDYDATNPAFATKQQMESYQFSTSTVPFTGCLHPVECARNLNVLGSQFVRTGPVTPGTDLRLYDMGNFQLATAGMQSEYVVGELWVTYDVLFRKPRLPANPAGFAYTHMVTGPLASGTYVKPFGLQATFLANDLVLRYDGASGKLILPTPGTYYLNAIANVGGGFYAIPVPGSNIGIDVGDEWFGFPQPEYQNANNNVRSTQAVIVHVKTAGTTEANGLEFKLNDGNTGLDADLLVIKVRDYPHLSQPTITNAVRVPDDEKSELRQVLDKNKDNSSSAIDPVKRDCGCEYVATAKGLRLRAMCAGCWDDSDIEAETNLTRIVRDFHL